MIVQEKISKMSFFPTILQDLFIMYNSSVCLIYSYNNFYTPIHFPHSAFVFSYSNYSLIIWRTFIGCFDLKY